MGPLNSIGKGILSKIRSFFTQVSKSEQSIFYKSILPSNNSAIRIISNTIIVVELIILSVNILGKIQLQAPYHLIQFSIIPILIFLKIIFRITYKSKSSPITVLRISYIYPVIFLFWAASLGAASYQYYGQFTAYIIGISSIAFLFYMEVQFLIGLYVFCTGIFIILTFFWGMTDQPLKVYIGIFSNLFIVNFVAVLASRINFSVRLKLYINEMKVNEHNQELKYLNTKLEDLASTDSLTGIANRHQLDLYLNEISEKNKKEPIRLSCSIFDVDHFKIVNDTFGHLAGDLVLQELSQLVKNSIRDGDIFGRWGGEEFLLIYPDCGLDQAYASSEHIRKSVENHKMSKGMKITCSFGIAEILKEDNNESFVARADKALYRAKNNGRNKVEK